MSHPVTALHPTAHARVRVRPDAGLARTAALNMAAVTVREFDQACANFPVVFVKDGATGRLGCVALFGLSDGENLFVSHRDGIWSWNATYAPEAVRRYPFALGAEDGAAGAPGDMPLCLIEDPACVGETAGERLFDDKGAETPFLASMKRMLSNLVAGQWETDTRLALLVERRVMREIAVVMTHQSGRSHRLEGLYAPDRDALAALADDDIAALHRAGALALAYGSAASLAQLTRLVQLKNMRGEDPIIAIGGTAPRAGL
ncbi:MAG: SapC family protein [Caulobacterales bacterium]|nr:SapC family protein [Caulobacterales bacterium]